MTLKSNAARSLSGATIGNFFGFSAVAVFGPTAAMLDALMGLSPFELGLLIATPALSGSLLRIPFSAWVDTNGGRKPFLILLALSGIGIAGLALLTGLYPPEQISKSFYPMVLLLGLLCGCGIATFSVGVSQISYWYPQARQGHALGVYGGVGNLSPGLFALLLPLILSDWSMATAYAIWVVILLLATGAYLLLCQNAPYFQFLARGENRTHAAAMARQSGQEVFPAKNALESLKRSSSNWRTWALVGIYFTSFGGFIALTAWLPTYWQRLHDVSLVQAGVLTAVFAALASLVRIVSGSLADQHGGEKLSAIALLVLAFASAVVSISSGFIVAGLHIAVIAVCMGVINAAVFKLLPMEIPDAIGGAAGWIGGLGAFGGFVIPLLLVSFVESVNGDRSGYAQGFTVFTALALTSLFVVAMLWLKRSGVQPGRTKRVPVSAPIGNEIA